MSGLLVRAACGGIRTYQRFSHGRAPVCRFSPSCSAYALQALNEHGAIRGTWLAVRRLARCHPWSPVRCDPVPGAPSKRLVEGGC